MERRSFLQVLLGIVAVAALPVGVSTLCDRSLMFFGHNLAASGKSDLDIARDVNTIVHHAYHECYEFAQVSPPDNFLIDETKLDDLAMQLRRLEQAAATSKPHASQSAYDDLALMSSTADWRRRNAMVRESASTNCHEAIVVSHRIENKGLTI